MKVAFLGIKGLPSKGGGERVAEAIAARLKEWHDLTVYCDRNYTPEGTTIPGIRLIRLPCLQGKHSRSLSLFLLSAVHALFMGDYDLIHLHNSEACFIAPLLRMKYPVVATSHGPAYDRNKWNKATKFLLRLMDNFFMIFPNKLTSVSLPMAEYYQTGWGRQVLYIPNGVENRLPVDEATASSTLNRNEVGGEYLLFSAGRMDPTKGCHYLLEAFRGIETDLNLLVIGDASTDPAYGQELMQMADSRVRFIPFIADKAELFGLLQKARLFVFPSTVEAMSMALLEAASLGVPIICSDIPPNLAVLPEQALHFPSADVYDLRNKLGWALQHDGEMREIGLKAQKWVRKEFAWDVVSQQYHQLYLLLNKNNSGNNFSR